MPRKRDLDLAEALERAGQQLTDEQKAEIDLWERGRALSHVVGGFAWDVILDTLKSYEESAGYRLQHTDPSQKEDVLAEHAVWFAAGRIYESFVNDTAKAVDAAKKTPAAVARGIREMQPGPPESVA